MTRKHMHHYNINKFELQGKRGRKKNLCKWE